MKKLGKKEWKRRVLSYGLVLAMLFSINASTVFAGSGVIYIPKKGAGYTKCADTRSGDHDFVRANCSSVYPTKNGIEDTYTTILCHIEARSNNGVMSKEYEVVEGQSSKVIYINSQCKNIKSINFCFGGHSPNCAANAVVSWNAL